MSMQVTETTVDGLKREYTVVVPVGDVESQLVSKLAELGRTVTIPGFRPGKVPVTLLRKRYGDSVRGEVLEKTIQDSWQQALTDKGLRPAAEPKVEIVTFEEGKDLEYKLNVELLPEIKPVDFGAIELERRTAKIEETEIDAALGRMAENRRTFIAVSDGRAAKESDQVVIDFTGVVDGEPFAGGEVNDFQLEIGRGGFLPGFEEQVVGMKATDKKEIKVNMPDDHPNEELKGKEVVFDVTVKEVQEATAVEIDEEFAKSLGTESLDALKAAVREQIETEYAQLSRMHLKRALLDQLAESHDFELPEGILDAEFDSIWKQLLDAKERDALDEDDKTKTDDELKERYLDIATRRVRLGLLISEIGQSNNITVTQDDLNRAMHREASRLPGQEAQVLQYFQQNPDAMQELQAPIFEDKVVDFIVEMAKITETEVSVEELMRDPDEPVAEEPAGKKAAKGKKASKPKAKKADDKK
ncbi:MAG: trigger factor [Alphaproteobacteria bacterium]|jgi:trigger factor